MEMNGGTARFDTTAFFDKRLFKIVEVEPTTCRRHVAEPTRAIAVRR
jgi:hypothetical protein